MVQVALPSIGVHLECKGRDQNLVKSQLPVSKGTCCNQALGQPKEPEFVANDCSHLHVSKALSLFPAMVQVALRSIGVHLECKGRDHNLVKSQLPVSKGTCCNQAPGQPKEPEFVANDRSHLHVSKALSLFPAMVQVALPRIGVHLECKGRDQNLVKSQLPVSMGTCCNQALGQPKEPEFVANDCSHLHVSKALSLFPAMVHVALRSIGVHRCIV